MEQRQTISQITECVISEMERMQYSPQTISTFRVKAKQLSRYVQEKTGTDYFTEELGRRYLADTIGFPFAEKRWLTSPESAHIRCVRRIGEYQLYGAVLRNYAKKSKILGGWELGDKKLSPRMSNPYKLRTIVKLRKNCVSTISDSSMSFWHHGNYPESMTYLHRSFQIMPHHSKGNLLSIRSTG